MDLGRIKAMKAIDEDESFDLTEIAEIQAAFDELVASGVELRDLPENATVTDMLEELEENASPLEKIIYDYVVDQFGENEAQDPSWSTKALADHLNKVEIILGADNGTIGDLLQ